MLENAAYQRRVWKMKRFLEPNIAHVPLRFTCAGIYHYDSTCTIKIPMGRNISFFILLGEYFDTPWSNSAALVTINSCLIFQPSHNWSYFHLVEKNVRLARSINGGPGGKCRINITFQLCNLFTQSGYPQINHHYTFCFNKRQWPLQPNIINIFSAT